VQELVEDLAARFPDDADDLRGASEVLRKQRISSCDRLGKLSDSQWQRLDLPIGIEALLRDEASRFSASAPSAARATAASEPTRAAVAEAGALAATGPSGLPPQPAPALAQLSADEDGELPLERFDLPESGVRRRCGGGHRTADPPQSCRGSEGGSSRGWSASPRRHEKSGFMPAVDLAPPPDLEVLWQQLLEDTLPPDKRRILEDAWETTHEPHDKYMMYLEYTSYLRKPEMSDEEMAERRKQLSPLLDEFGLDVEEESDCPTAIAWILTLGILFFIAAAFYYMRERPEPVHDLQSL